VEGEVHLVGGTAVCEDEASGGVHVDAEPGTGRGVLHQFGAAANVVRIDDDDRQAQRHSLRKGFDRSQTLGQGPPQRAAIVHSPDRYVPAAAGQTLPARRLPISSFSA
jgi:hypothetical protein